MKAQKKKTTTIKKAEKHLLRRITLDDVVVTITPEPAGIPVKDNAVVSGDDDFDHGVENEILARLERGDEWAWALVRVSVYEPESTLRVDEYLQCCSYENEEDFRANSGYYDDMVAACLEALQIRLDSVVRKFRA
jgi:hypothetical protein